MGLSALKANLDLGSCSHTRVNTQVRPCLAVSKSMVLEMFWRSKDAESDHDELLFIVHNDGTGSLYENLNREGGIPIVPSDTYARVDRNDEAVDFLMEILGF